MITKNETDLRPAMAILDWGIGGMGFYGVFKEIFSQIGVCYFSDAGAIPYGKQSREQLLERLSLIVGFLRNRGVTHLVVACNAMSTVLPFWSLPENIADFYITGVIEPAISAVLDIEGETVGITGGRRTILSGSYSQPLRKASRRVLQRVAQPLSALIEKGEKDTPYFRAVLRKIMLPLRQTDILILACTHYLAAQDSFREFAPNAKIIDPAAETFNRIVKKWNFPNRSSTDIFYTTGDPEEMRTSSFKAFGIEIGEINRIPLGLEMG